MDWRSEIQWFDYVQRPSQRKAYTCLQSKVSPFFFFNIYPVQFQGDRETKAKNIMKEPPLLKN